MSFQIQVKQKGIPDADRAEAELVSMDQLE